MQVMKGLLFLRKTPVGGAVIVFLFAVGLIGLPAEQFGALFFRDKLAASLAGMVVCRALGAAVMLVFFSQLGLDCAPRKASRLWAALPALLVAINNAPIIALCSGSASVTAGTGYIALFAAECVFVALFEEVAFRAIIFALFLQHWGGEMRGRFFAVLSSSALFGAAHLLNLFGGAALAPTLLQTGYSFLIGAMLCIVLLSTGSVMICVCVHAVYNFGGMLVPTLGQGALWDIWNVPTICLTVLIAVLAFVCSLIMLLHISSQQAEGLYRLTARQKLYLRGARIV